LCLQQMKNKASEYLKYKKISFWKYDTPSPLDILKCDRKWKMLILLKFVCMKFFHVCYV
jgi:hypothetical protein